MRQLFSHDKPSKHDREKVTVETRLSEVERRIRTMEREIKEIRR